MPLRITLTEQHLGTFENDPRDALSDGYSLSSFSFSRVPEFDDNELVAVVRGPSDAPSEQLEFETAKFVSALDRELRAKRLVGEQGLIDAETVKVSVRGRQVSIPEDWC